MKTTAKFEQQRGTGSPTPFRVRECLVGMDFNVSVEALMRYLDFFAGQIPVDSVHFLHVLPQPNLFNLYSEENPVSFNEVEVNQEVIEKLRFQIDQSITTIEPSHFKIDVKEGDPLETLIETATELNADLVMIGHNVTQTHHGILTKNFARQVKSNALVVPSHAKYSLKKILIPVDFSENSAAALRTGIAINRQLAKPAKIGVLHTYHLPANFSAYRFNQYKVMEMLEEDRENAIQDFIGEHVPREDRSRTEPILLKHDHQSIGLHIASFAEKHKYDLIIMGAKGHSKVELLLMGSVTEKVLSLTRKVPVLVVK
jgi:nucleotide-binding universal stress UspA family protein